MKKFNDLKNFLRSRTARLASTYLSIIMLMSVAFSLIFYTTSMTQLDRQVPSKIIYSNGVSKTNSVLIGFSDSSLESFFTERVLESRKELIAQLIWINLTIFVFGFALSYYLARKTLAPIEEAFESQSRFVSDASHELRTPITTLKTTNEVALRKSKLTISEAKELIGHNVKEAAKLQSLTNNLLALLRQDEIIKVQSVSLQDVTLEAINSVLNEAMDKNIQIIDKTKNDTLLSSESHVEQLITILLDNSIKYSPKNSEISITSQKRGSWVYVKVKDQGIGIRQEDIAHIYDRFFRADNSRTTHKDAGGNGLGLSIAKSIVEKLNGDISVKSKYGKGSTFCLKIPTDKSKPTKKSV